MRKTWTRAELRLEEARTAARDWLAQESLSRLDQDVTLVVTELLSNAADVVEDADPLELNLQRSAEDLRISVSNPGVHFTLNRSMPSADSVRGRGLAIVDAIATSVEVQRNEHLITVSAVLAL